MNALVVVALSALTPTLVAQRVCSIDWSAIQLPSVGLTALTIDDSSAPSSNQVQIVDSTSPNPNVIPSFGPSFMLTANSPSAPTSTGGMYVLNTGTQVILAAQETNSFIGPKIYLRCNASSSQTQFRISTTLFGLDDSTSHTSTITLMYWNGVFFTNLGQPLVTMGGSTTQFTSLKIESPVTLMSPSTSIVLRFDISSSGNGPRDLVGVGTTTVDLVTATPASMTAVPGTPVPPGGSTTPTTAISTSLSPTGGVDSSTTTSVVTSGSGEGFTVMMEPPSSNSALIGGIVGFFIVLLLVGGLIAFCVARNRRANENVGELSTPPQSNYSDFAPTMPTNDSVSMHYDSLTEAEIGTAR